MTHPHSFDPVQWQATYTALLDELPDQELAQRIRAASDGLMKAHVRDERPEDGTWRIYTLADAYAERLPLQYVVSGLFPLPSLSIVYGAPGTLKSMILMEMCACVAAGIPWLPALPQKNDVTPRQTLQSPVLWCDFDNGKRRTDERIEAIGRAYGLPEDTPLHYVSMPSPWLDMSDQQATEQMIQRVADLGVKLVVIDNLGVVSGKADENSAEMAHVMANCRHLAEETGAAVILIHHQRKTTGNNSRVGESLRGHSSIEAALDLALLIEREEHADTLQLKSTKVRGPDVLPFGAMFTYEHKQGTDELAKVRFYGLPVEDVVSNAAVRGTILEVLEGQKLNKGQLKDAVKAHLPDVGLNRIGEQIDLLASEGKILLSEGAYNAKIYSLPSEQGQAACRTDQELSLSRGSSHQSHSFTPPLGG